MSYGQKFREIRRANLLSQEEFAAKIGVSRSIVSQVEIDKIKPTLEALRSVSQAFDVSLDYLMSNETPPEELQIDLNMVQDSKELVKSLKHNYPRMREDYPKILANRHLSEPQSNLIKVPYFPVTEQLRFRRVPSFIRDLGLHYILIPLTGKGPFIAFDGTDGMYNNGELLICSFIQTEDIAPGDLCVITTSNRILNGRMQTILRDEVHINDTRINLSDIQETWKIIRVMAEPEKMQSVMDKLNEIQKWISEKTK